MHLQNPSIAQADRAGAPLPSNHMSFQLSEADPDAAHSARVGEALGRPARSRRSEDAQQSTWRANQEPLDSSNELPPRYDSHQFPPTPPALARDDASFSYFNDDHEQQANPATALNPPSPRAFGSRFPRWGTWLEKRALERHYANLDSQASTKSPANNPSDGSGNRRKKSWGTWVEGPDAISDERSTTPSTSQSRSHAEATPLPPLHVHHFGSRFIPHLPAQPLCSILIGLPLSALHGHTIHTPSQTRQVLLIGTHLGLFAIEFRDPHSHSSNLSSEKSQQWNDDVRCVHIWSGLAVYQMNVLASGDGDTADGTPNANQAASSSGVLLALTCPSSARDGFISSSLMQLSAHAGSVLESVAAGGLPASGETGSSHSTHGMPHNEENIAAANFGPAAGGGSGRAVPPAGMGVVRMWHLQAIKQLLTYALDRPDAKTPIDLSPPSENITAKREGLGTILRKTFSRPKARSSAKPFGHGRSGSTTSLGDTIDPMPFHTDYAAASNGRSANSSSARTSLDEHQQQSSNNQRMGGNLPHRTGRPGPSSEDDGRHDGAYAAAFSLAMGSVPIQQPLQAASAAQASNSSSLSFADSVTQTASIGRQAGHKGKDRETGSQGVLFFSVHEASSDTKGAGTWYLAITYARSVMVYEAPLPRRGCPRAWSFVKELYAPFPIKAVAFAPTAVSDDLVGSASPGALLSTKGTTKLRVASPDGPLLTSKKGSQRELNSAAGAAFSSGGVGAARVLRGSAAPASWRKADLCLLLSFGRRAVLIRLRDSEVRDFELTPLPQLSAAADGLEGAQAPQLSLQPLISGVVGGEAQLSPDSSKLLSPPGEGALRAESLVSSTIGHSRHGSMEQRLRDAFLEKRSNKHHWIGFSTIEARILVRQQANAGLPSQGYARMSQHPSDAGSRLSPMGVSMMKDPATAPSLSHADVNKALPRAPVNQNASFERRLSRMHLSDQNAQFHDAIQTKSNGDDDSDTDEEDDMDNPASQQAGRAKYQLIDPGPLLRRRREAKPPRRSASAPAAELVAAKLAIASKSNVTHILPLPLAADEALTAPLAVMQWSSTPNAVSGWARVLGVERAASSGAVPVSHLHPASSGSSSAGRAAGRDGDDRLVLHVGVTCVAFLASRIEARKVSFKMSVAIGFRVSRDAELELVPRSPGHTYGRAHTGAESSFSVPSDDDGLSTSKSGGWFGYPEPGISPRPHTRALSQELEYLCAPLVTLPAVDLDVRSCGANELAPAAPHGLVPDPSGDATVVAFDWRGADDFRIFTVGIAG